MEFILPNKRLTIDLIQYIYQIKSNHPTVSIHVGCDSVSKDGYWYYVLVVAFRYGTNGAHFIYRKTKIPAIRIESNNGRMKPDIFTKLWKEAEISIGCVEYLIENGIYVDAIELDYNTIPRHYSERLLKATYGWALSTGCRVLDKSGEQIAVKAADHICDHI
jgi:predicted RNase H-related nuclease YkuK (DUF458 family)